ncbi:MAG TPA: hypothetical protein VH333_10860 [Pseudonocardiaceae bacterium]|jgi:hypothetical protein|nr:hypothetical protein [Pseudonocardiaceae bacterium]
MSDVSSSKKKVRGVLGLVGLVFGALGAVRELKAASGNRDSLALVNAVLNFAAVLTGAALAVRALRKDGDEE